MRLYVLRFSVLEICTCILLFSLYMSQIRADYPFPPDGYYCSASLGFRNPAIAACQAAWEDIPRGSLSSIFTTRPRTSTNNYVQVPDAYSDNDANPLCTITIDLDGHSENDVFVLVPYDVIKEMTENLISKCVTEQMGGMMTYGMAGTLNTLLEPTAYDGSAINVPLPSVVEQPDGTVHSIAIPPPAVGPNVPDGGYSESFSPRPFPTVLSSRQSALICYLPHSYWIMPTSFQTGTQSLIHSRCTSLHDNHHFWAAESSKT